MLEEEEAMKQADGASQDPFAMLFRTLRQKKQFNIYESKYNRFKRKSVMTILRMAQHYYEDDRFVASAGEEDFVNIQEFKNAKATSAMIKVVERSEDISTMFGKQMAIQHILQFVGQQLEPKQRNKIISQLPLLGDEKLKNDLTAQETMIENEMLAMDRGEVRQARPFDNHPDFIDAFRNRINSPDFAIKIRQNPQVKEIYDNRIKQHENMMAERIRQENAAKAGFIPMGGGLVAVNMSSPDPETGKNRRIHLPSAAIEWMIQRMQEQGMQEEVIGKLSDPSQIQPVSKPTGDQLQNRRPIQAQDVKAIQDQQRQAQVRG
jgi:hypothetical protein